MASAEGLRRSVKGLSEIEFRERFGTEEACRKALFDMNKRHSGYPFHSPNSGRLADILGVMMEW